MKPTNEPKLIGDAMQVAVADAVSNFEHGCCKIIHCRPPRNLPKGDRSRSLITKLLREAIIKLAAGESPWPLLIHGDVGSGKTCAALCMVEHYGGYFTTFAKFHARLRQAMAGELQSPIAEGVGGYRIYETQVWAEWKTANLAVIDDFGSRKATDFQYDTLKQAIEERQCKPTVYTSNFTLEEISQAFDDRISSRLSAGTTIKLKGDRRLHRP